MGELEVQMAVCTLTYLPFKADEDKVAEVERWESATSTYFYSYCEYAIVNILICFVFLQTIDF